MDAEKLSISLPRDVAQMIRRQVAAGTYTSDSAMIEDALRLWQDRAEARTRQLDSIRERIDVAANNPDRLSAQDVRRHFERRFAAADQQDP